MTLSGEIHRALIGCCYNTVDLGDVVYIYLGSEKDLKCAYALLHGARAIFRISMSDDLMLVVTGFQGVTETDMKDIRLTLDFSNEADRKRLNALVDMKNVSFGDGIPLTKEDLAKISMLVDAGIVRCTTIHYEIKVSE